MQASTTQKLIQKILYATTVSSSALIFVLLIHTASQLSRLAAPAERFVSIGPWRLMRLAKDPIEGGFAAHFEMLPGLIWYAAGTVVISAVLVFVLITWRRHARRFE